MMPTLPRSHWATWRQQWLEWRGVWITAPVVAGLVIALRLTGGLQILEWAAFDQFFRWRSLEPPDRRIVIVGINESDIERLGQWPPSDRVIAQLLEKIKQQQPATIGLDLFRNLPIEPGNRELKRMFETTPNLIGIEFLANPNQAAIGPPPVLKEKNQVGFANVIVDADERLRRAVLYADTKDAMYDSLALRLALLYLQPRGIVPDENPHDFQIGRTIFPRFRANDGGYVQTEDVNYQILLNFRGPARSFTTVSLFDVLENRIAPDLLRDKVVLIGSTAVSVKDFFSTPFSGTPFNVTNNNPIRTPAQTAGVEIHANIVSHLLSAILDGRSSIYVWNESLEGLWIFLWSGIGAGLSWQLRSRRWAPVLVVMAGSGLAVGSFLAFVAGWWVPLIPPLLALVSSSAIVTAYTARSEQEQRRTIMNLFERHVTPKIAEEIWRNRQQFFQKGRLPGRRMVATVLFTDLKNFTPIACNYDPETLMTWLNEYLEAMAQIVVTHGGVVDKFIGDSVMAVFGVPIPRTTSGEIATTANQAVQTALAMANKLEQLNRKWANEGLPAVDMRVGIATGDVVAGMLGGFQKLDYTVIGDTVNVAARLESYDKSFAKTLRTGVCRILINESAYEYVKHTVATEFVTREQLRGREDASAIYQVLW